MIIDAHQHFWAPARGDYGWMEGNDAVASIRRNILPRDLAPMLARHGIDRTVLVQAAPSVAETEYMLGLADATDWIAKVVGWVDFNEPSHARHVAHFAAHPKFAGLRPMIQDIADVDWMLSAHVQWAYEAIIAHDLTFDALGFPRHLDSFLKLFARHPQMRAVIDHGMKPAIRDGEFAAWASGIEKIAARTRVFCKISGLATEARPGWSAETLAPYVRHLIDCFGPERLMWGSDWPVLELAGNYDGWFAAARALVPKPMHEAIFGGTAASFYRIT